MNIFSELMSDYIPNSEQNMELVAAGSQPNSSRASPDSTDPGDGAEITMQCNAWPPLEVTYYGLNGWPNSNTRPTCEPSASKETVTQDCDIATPITTPLSQPAPGLACGCRRMKIGRGHGCNLRFPRW